MAESVLDGGGNLGSHRGPLSTASHQTMRIPESDHCIISYSESDVVRRGTATTGELKMKTYGAATWQGGIRDGKGAISTRSGALKEHPYGFGSRFEGTPGTNPEELIGAAHAGCFTMALSLMLGEAQHRGASGYPGRSDA